MKRLVKTTVIAFTLSVSLASLSSPAFAASYQVQDNDSLWTISEKNQLSLEAVINANMGVDMYNLQSGQTITLPVSTEHSYAVQKGDSFWTIAQKLNIPLDLLMAANSQYDPYNLYPGLVLELPEGYTNSNHSVAALSASPESAPAPASNAQTITTPTGETYTYSKVIQASATAYSASHEENGWGPVDYYGNPLKLGTIAVDPAVIPMNSTVYITGYNSQGLPVGGMIGKATDQGGAIKGDRIDIFMPGSRSTASQFGIQNVTVYVLN
ncbi:Cell wall-binding protein yocH precursor [Chlamydia abortus]|uniref:LysM peptidoglycan-binding domain-containing protein n=1 Tax=Paenibacillus residui TaxID=629724 RepID=A0ABW3D9Z9_9BACL|nr:LysM peptidoglycan-binding domain-containing protein [Paenibacillus sp. 32O-W]SHE10623.1 Cell wall-binding protein yocH precursor [Chlamydia abortus]